MNTKPLRAINFNHNTGEENFMQTENIVMFLQTAYTDEKLAALLAHAQDGKLAFDTCCCLIGIPTANHALKGARPTVWVGWSDGTGSTHHFESRGWQFGRLAEHEFAALGQDDAERRERIIPLIIAEQERRAALRANTEVSEAVTV